MERVGRMLETADRWQQRRRAAAVAVAVWAKFRDDGGAWMAAMLAYFAFVAIFPLLLVFVTVLGLVLRSDPGLHQRLLDSAAAGFPIIGPMLRTNVHGMAGSGLSLAIGLVWAVLGSRGAANALQTVLNTIWQVPKSRWPGFPFNWLRSFGVLGVAGVALLVTGALSGIGGTGAVGAGERAGALVISAVINVGVFILAFRLAASPHVASRRLVRGAVAAGLCWQVLLWVASYLVAHELRHSTELYGAFGVVLGLLVLLYLQARGTVLAAETDAVLAMRLWPRALTQPPLTPADRAAYRGYVDTQNRRPEQRVRVGFDGSGGAPAPRTPDIG